MNMATWVDLDFTFDIPIASFAFPLRDFIEGRRKYLSIKEPNMLQVSLYETLHNYRPELKDGIIVAMSINQGGQMMLEFTIAHPSLPKVAFGARPQTFRLQKCKVCDGDVPYGDGVDCFIRTECPFTKDPGRVVQYIVCSEKCANADYVPIDDVKPDIIQEKED
jgi:hypothetical protein